MLTSGGSAGWDDVGDFSSLAELLPAEANQPRILGDGGLGTSLFQFGSIRPRELTGLHSTY